MNLEIILFIQLQKRKKRVKEKIKKVPDKDVLEFGMVFKKKQ